MVSYTLIMLRSVARPISGDDESGDGTLENPYRTMAKAYSEVTDGGRIEVGPGTYEEASLTIDTGVTITGSEVEGE